MLPRNKCLECGKLLWDDLPDYKPKAGYGIICIYCGGLMELDKNLNFIKPKEITQLMLEGSGIIKLLNALKANPFNGDEDKFNIGNKIIPSH